MSVPSVEMMKLMALPAPSSSLGRTDTGMPAVSDLPGSALRSSRKRRSAPPQIASTTSLSVQPAAAATARSRSMAKRWVAKRRFSRTRPFSTDMGALNGTTMPSPDPMALLAILPKAVTSCGTVLACIVISCMAPATAWVTVGISASGCRAAWLARGAAPEAQNGGSARLAAAVEAMARCNSFTPETPSISEWCILMNSAKRLPSSPSMMVHSQGGRVRSIGVLCSRPTSSPSSRSPPGQGSAAWRTWYSRSMWRSSTHSATGFMLKAYLSLRFHGAVNLRWLRNSVMSWRMKSLGASGGSLNCSRPPTWLGVARVSVNSQAASSGFKRVEDMGVNTFRKGSRTVPRQQRYCKRQRSRARAARIRSKFDSLKRPFNAGDWQK